METLTNLHWVYQFGLLYWAHLVLDFSLQTNFMSEWKGKSWYVLWVHSVIWTGGLLLVLWLTGRIDPWDLGILLVVHFFVDGWKARGWYKKVPQGSRGLTDFQAFALDQDIHLVQLIVVFVW